jgi:beta-barrel assembly-enhancing protease
MQQLLGLLLATMTFSSLAQSSCLTDPARTTEVARFDEAQMREYQQTRGTVEVPKRLASILERLKAVSPRLKNRPIELVGYRHPRINAHAADHGLVGLTSAVWEGATALDEDETAALLAHELAHIEERHSLAWACSAVARMGSSEISVKDALDTLAMELFGSESDLAKGVRHELHGRELFADHRGVALLHAAGFDPRGMTRLLAKLHQADPASGVALRGGTHPDSEQRVMAARRAVARLNAVRDR